MLSTADEEQKLISNIFPWTPTHGHSRVGQLVKTYINQLCANTGYCPEDLLRAMSDKNGWHALMIVTTIFSFWKVFFSFWFKICFSSSLTRSPKICTQTSTKGKKTLSWKIFQVWVKRSLYTLKKKKKKKKKMP